MSVIALRDSIKTALDAQLGAAADATQAGDRLKIAEAFATGIDPHFVHAGSASAATATAAGLVRTDATAADPVVYLKATTDTLLAGKSDTTHHHDAAYLKLAGGTVTGLATFRRSGQNTVFDSGAATDARIELHHNGTRKGSLSWASAGITLAGDAGTALTLAPGSGARVTVAGTLDAAALQVGGTAVSLAGHTHDFAALANRPTTLAGFGITDASAASHHHDAQYLALAGGTLAGALALGGAANTTQLAVEGNVSQTGYLQEWRNASNARLLSVDWRGAIDQPVHVSEDAASLHALRYRNSRSNGDQYTALYVDSSTGTVLSQTSGGTFEPVDGAFEAFRFTTGAAQVHLGAVVVYLQRSPTASLAGGGYLRGRLYAADAATGLPAGGPLAYSSTRYIARLPTTGSTGVPFRFTVSLNAATDYWFVLERISVAADEVFVEITPAAATGAWATSANATAWTGENNKQARFSVHHRTPRGVHAQSYGSSDSANGAGLYAYSQLSPGAMGQSETSFGVYGSSTGNWGGYFLGGHGVYAQVNNPTGYGVMTDSNLQKTGFKLWAGDYEVLFSGEYLRFEAGRQQLSSVFMFDGAVWEDNTTVANQHGGSPFVLLHTGAGAYTYFGLTSGFYVLNFDGTAAAAHAGLTWEYSRGGGVWQAFTPTADETRGFTRSGEVRWSTAATPAWAQETVNGASRYWVRVSAASLTVEPLARLASRGGFSGHFARFFNGNQEKFRIHGQGALYTAGPIYPGSSNDLTAVQTARSISDNGTALVVSGALEAGSISTSRYTATAPTGLSPLVVSSTTLVANLNADLLDGQDGSHYLAWGNLTGKPTTLAGYGITDAAASGHTHAFSALTGRPTTLAGYGITDAAASTHGHDATYLRLDGTGAMAGMLEINRVGDATARRRGISWYSSAYRTWITYMTPVGTAGPNGVNAVGYGEVNSWAIRSNVENSAGYGWVWESHANADTSTAATPMMALSSAAGNLKVRGTVDAGGFSTATGALGFGATVRQMINLWNTSYGIGVQANTLYLRTGSNLAVYAGGTHNDNASHAGGGTPLLLHDGSSAGMRVYGHGTGTALTGLGRGQLHVQQTLGAAHEVAALTFGSSRNGSNDAQAGMYVQTDGSYGSRIYLRTTNSYAAGVNQAGLMIASDGKVGVGQDATGYRLTVAGDVYANQGWLRTSGNSGWYSESWGGGMYMEDATWVRVYNGKSLYAPGEIRAGGGYSFAAGNVINDNLQGLWFNQVGDSSYAVFREGGAWAHPYPDLRIAFHTGIKIGGHYTYGGTRFYNNSDMATEILSVGNGDSNVRVPYSLFVNTSNSYEAGLVLSDDGDFVDLNDGYGSLRFAYGVRVYSGNRGGTPVITLASNGQVTASSYYTSSSREVKRDVRRWERDAVALLDEVEVVSFAYRDDAEARPRVGFVAEDTDPLLSGPEQKSFDTTNVAAVLIRAAQQLAGRERALEARVARLEAALREAR